MQQVADPALLDAQPLGPPAAHRLPVGLQRRAGTTGALVRLLDLDGDSLQRQRRAAHPTVDDPHLRWVNGVVGGVRDGFAGRDIGDQPG